MYFPRLLRQFDGTDIEVVDRELNSLGAEGWEIAETNYEAMDDFAFIVTMKRQVKN